MYKIYKLPLFWRISIDSFRVCPGYILLLRDHHTAEIAEQSLSPRITYYKRVAYMRI